MDDEGIIYVNGKDWVNAIKKLEQSKLLTAQAADKALAEIGKEGRKIITDKEEQVFEFGKMQYKGYHSTPKVYSKFNSTTGGWESKSDGRRLSGFKFESAAYSRSRGLKYKVVSEGRIFSNMSNLWDKPTKPYRESGSPFFRDAESNKWGRWRGGKPRPNSVKDEGGGTKSTLVWNTNEIRPVIGSALNTAGAKMVKRINKELNQ